MEQSNGIQDQNIEGYRPLITPYQLNVDIPRTNQATETVVKGRQGIKDILDGKDSRKFIIVGPCSIHDPAATQDYAHRLKDLSEQVSGNFEMIMRTYFEKPRTALGWKGMLYDPDINGTNDMNKGLHVSREILSYVSELGLPAATELIEVFTPQYNSDLVSWVAIGARTVESPQHRQMASGLSMPVGFKNSTQGDIGAAVNGVISARGQHSFPGIDQYGASSQVDTLGNSYTHVVLRGGGGETNYDEASVQEAKRLLGEAKLQQNVVIDCSHDNSQKDHEKQLEVFESIMQQIKDGDKGIVGIMLESNIEGGKQSIPTDLRGFDPSTELKYGKSITDACISWETTEEMIKDASRDLSRSVFTTGI